jgi:uncharacterized membrane protein YidH (DUF202 family)
LLSLIYPALAALAPTIRLEETDYHVSNPIGLAWAPDTETPLLIAPALGCIVAAVVSLLLRFRRARGVERQQLKSFTYAAVVLVVGFLVLVYLVPPAGVFEAHGVPYLVWGLLVAPVPVATGIAILRYRLFDIDRLINRTLVYGSLTAVLIATYVALVVGTQALFRLATGQTSELAIVVSTLAIAALFQPLRRRIQDAIDRRFYRRKYDAQKTVAAFAARLREGMAPEELRGELLRVVRETVQPTQVGLWLRPQEARR